MMNTSKSDFAVVLKLFKGVLLKPKCENRYFCPLFLRSSDFLDLKTEFLMKRSDCKKCFDCRFDQSTVKYFLYVKYLI